MIARTIFRLLGLVAALIISQGVSAQTLTDIYVNHFNINADGTAGSYNGGFSKNGSPMSYAPADQVGSRGRLAPNTAICDEQTTQAGIDYWCGNQYVQVLTFANDPIPAAGGATSGTFKGCFGVNDMASGYQLKPSLRFLIRTIHRHGTAKRKAGRVVGISRIPLTGRRTQFCREDLSWRVGQYHQRLGQTLVRPMRLLA